MSIKSIFRTCWKKNCGSKFLVFFRGLKFWLLAYFFILVNRAKFEPNWTNLIFDIFLLLKFVYSEKATKFCEISILLLSTVHTEKSKVEILHNFEAFSERMKFINSLKFKGSKYQGSSNVQKLFAKDSPFNPSDAGRWKTLGGPVVIGGDNLPSPGSNRVNWSAKYWGGQWPPGPPGSGTTGPIQLFLKFILRRPQNFAKSPLQIWLALHTTNLWWRFRKILWPSQNVWTLLQVAIGYYFESKRALATGIAETGSGFGTFVFATLLTILATEFGTPKDGTQSKELRQF